MKSARDEALPELPEALSKQTEALLLMAAKGETACLVCANINGVTYKLDEKSAGIERVLVCLKGNKGYPHRFNYRRDRNF